MFSFFKKAPKWAKIFTYREYKKFIELLECFFSNNNIQTEINEEGFFLIGDLSYDLEDLTIKCFHRKFDDWIDPIENYLNSIIDTHNFNSQFFEDKANFDFIKPYLSFKTLPTETVDAIGRDNLYIEKMFSNLERVLIFKFQNGGYQMVCPDAVSTWNKSREEIFKVVCNNYKDYFFPKLNTENIKGFDLNYFTHIDCSNILLSEEYFNSILGSEGALFIMPNEHTLFFYTINEKDLNCALASAFLINIIFQQVKNEESAFLSDKLFWYKETQILEVEFEFISDKVTVFGPEEFVNMIEKVQK